MACWQTILVGDDRHLLVRMFPCNHQRFPTINSRNIAVVIDADGVKLLDVPRLDAGVFGTTLPFFKLFRHAVTLDRLLPLFMARKSARDIFNAFTEWTEGKEDSISEKRIAWKLYDRHDRCLVLAKDFIHHCSRQPYEGIPIAVVIWSNGISLHHEPLTECEPPDDNQRFLFILPYNIQMAHLEELFTQRDAAEIIAAFRMNRKHLFNLVQKDENRGVVNQVE